MSLSPDSVTPPREDAHTRLLIVLIVIEVFAVFETAMAIAAIPTFMKVFDADAAAVGWTTTAYLLVGAAVAATAGRLGDIFGRKNVLVTVLCVAACGSFISVLATDLWMVVLGRGVQGVAAGALPLSFGLVRELLPERRVPLAIALLGGIVPICAGAGGLLAGVLIDHSGWRLMFMVATGMGAAAVLTTLAGLPRTPGIRPRPPVDIAGAVLLVPASGGLLFGVTQGEDWGWTDGRVLASLLVGLASLAAWVWWERRVREPIVDVRQFTHRKLALTTLATIAIGVGPMGAASILGHIILQLPASAPVGHGLSVTEAGFVLLIAAVVGYGGSALSGRIAQVVGARWSMVIACVLYLVGAGLLMVTVQSLVGASICLGLLSVGSAFAFTAMPNLVVEVVPAEQTGAATGMNRVIMNVSIATGLSLASVIMATSTAPGTHLPTEAALTSVCLFMIGATLVCLLITAFIANAGRAGVRREPTPDLGGAKQAAA
ncbi:MFS transporter [Actinomadura rugatobispora]|uniref:MFS transporter n=1 Tax=Actinomadura rugatobispora TaxID=1994 RepID=A0ABW1A6K0_9ACTN|nr:MFS transporter [Actinomadura rugatobispora]